MIFPNLNLWSARVAGNAAELIDRTLENRQHRLVAGIAVDKNFSRVDGCLAVIRGQGKFAKLVHAEAAVEFVPPAVGKSCVAILNNLAAPAGETNFVFRDLAEVQAQVLADLKLKAGKYVDRILAVAVTGPGRWYADFDGQCGCDTMCDPTEIAELTGVNVIDGFQKRDLAVGGNGRHLAALPVWILFADRNSRVANRDCVLVDASNRPIQIYHLPASDGLDAELPHIRLQNAASSSLAETIDRLQSEYSQNRIVVYQALQANNPVVGADPKMDSVKIDSVKIDSVKMDPVNTDFGSGVESFNQLFGDQIELRSLVAAMLGLFYIDQLPANVPSLTGANAQRILGNLTPGSPSNWRHLIRTMAQHRPAPMKLKDAV